MLTTLEYIMAKRNAIMYLIKETKDKELRGYLLDMVIKMDKTLKEWLPYDY